MTYRLCQLRYRTYGWSVVEQDEKAGKYVHQMTLVSPAYVEEPVSVGDVLLVENGRWEVVSVDTQTIEE